MKWLNAIGKSIGDFIKLIALGIVGIIFLVGFIYLLFLPITLTKFSNWFLGLYFPLTYVIILLLNKFDMLGKLKKE